ncbi:MAG: tRNA(fMet)-specific endonuclease VapC [Sphingomonadales bacterium]|jgi:tRNA(fMet)-specific endonuclease VapC|nr:tRNA(fMet)-specific endonuclease VapC [Sphingomonadales bacterium]
MDEPGFLLDSDICIYALLGRSDVLRKRLGEQPEGAVAISAVTLAEVGVGYGAAIDDADELKAFLAQVEVLPFDDSAARVYAALQFRRGSFDRLIAAHALATGRTLITNNEVDFSDVPRLNVENWTKM